MEEFFENIQLFVSPKTLKTGRLEIRYVCEGCHSDKANSNYYEIPCNKSGVPLVHKTKFWCEECWRVKNSGIS